MSKNRFGKLLNVGADRAALEKSIIACLPCDEEFLYTDLPHKVRTATYYIDLSRFVATTSAVCPYCGVALVNESSFLSVGSKRRAA